MDLRGVGTPVHRPVAGMLFGPVPDAPAEPTGTVRRPSPATVLFLENGGGKSVLIKLIFSVMLPGRRQVVGTANTRVLEKFVLAEDVAHVVLEWQHTRSGVRVITGKVAAWRDHVVSSDPNRLSEAWYSFRPTPAFGLDTLPFAEGGRRVSLAGFRDRFDEAHKAEPELQAVWETGHRAWSEHLVNLELDPELFRYQRRMNSGEGEAAEAFAFARDEAFVDWLLAAVTSADDTRSLGDLVDGYAGRLAERDTLTAERDFVDGALGLLEPLAAAADDLAAAEEARRAAHTRAQTLAAAVAARRAEAAQRLALLAGRAEEATSAAQHADAAQRRSSAVVGELRRHLTDLRLQAARAERAGLEAERDAARRLLEAWQATTILVRYESAHSAAEHLRQLVAEKERDAAPVLAARDAAARRLARALLALAADADSLADAADTEAAQLGTPIGDAEDAERAATRLAERERAAAAAARTTIDDARAALRLAVTDGVLADGAGFADVAAAALAATEAEGEAAGQVEAADAELDALATERVQASDELRAADSAAAQAGAAAVNAERVLADATAAASALTAEPRLADLLGVEEITLDTLDGDAAALLDRLSDAVSHAEDELVALRIASDADGRVLDALGTDGLLPPTGDVATALDCLERSGITAWSGWQYLAQRPAAERKQIITTCPHLVGGIVLNSAAQIPAAQAALEEARLLPRSIVAVGDRVALLDRDAPAPAGIGFVIPPNPAMYDAERAERERQEILLRQQASSQRRAELDTRLRADRRLIEKLAVWQRDYPPGTLDALREARAAAESMRADTEAAVTARRVRHNKIVEMERTLRSRLPGLRRAHTHLRDTAEALARLAEQAAAATEAIEIVETAGAAARAAEQDARGHRTAARRLREAQYEARRRGDDQRRVAATCREELSQVTGGGTGDDDTPTPDTSTPDGLTPDGSTPSESTPDTSVPQAPTPAEPRPSEPKLNKSMLSEPVPAEPVPVLRAAWQAAVAAYQRVEIGADLRADLEKREATEAEARADVEKISAAVRSAAAEALGGPDGVDDAARAAATARAARAVVALDSQVNDAAVRVGSLEIEYTGLAPQDVSLEPYGRPRDIDHGRELLDRASAALQRARADYERIRAQADALRTDLDATRGEAQAFANVLDGFGELRPSTDARGALGAPETSEGGETAEGAGASEVGEVGEAGETGDVPEAGVAPFAGTVDEARNRRSDARAAFREATDALGAARRTVRAAADALAQYSASRRFEPVASPVRTQILAIPRDELPGYAAEWTAALRPRLRTLEDDLGQVNRHRATIIARLRGMVQAALATLRLAQRLSKLPDGLGDWSGQDFLRIRCTAAEPAALDERLAEVIDTATAAPTGSGTARGQDAATAGTRAAGKRDGLTLLLRGVHAALAPRGVQVDMLKPDAVLRTERVRVSEISDVFSGGQLLTAAIILYCTMASLRANERGQANRLHAGVLFLDNPIGRASAGYLLELQKAVADRLGVQLVYTTGLFEPNALAVFPLVVRLRNDADLRAGMKYLSVAEEIRAVLPADPPDGTGLLSGTRIFTRPTVTAESP